MGDPPYIHSGSNSAPPLGREVDATRNPKKLMADAQKFYFRLEDISKEDLCLFQDTEVQGLSGDNIQDEDDDEEMLSGDMKLGQSGDLENHKLDTGLVKCSSVHKPEEGHTMIDSVGVLEEFYKDSKGPNEEEDVSLPLLFAGSLIVKECSPVALNQGVVWGVRLLAVMSLCF
jgi:hypothetical protein